MFARYECPRDQGYYLIRRELKTLKRVGPKKKKGKGKGKEGRNQRVKFFLLALRRYEPAVPEYMPAPKHIDHAQYGVHMIGLCGPKSEWDLEWNRGRTYTEFSQ
jgi:hypothetical protein